MYYTFLCCFSGALWVTVVLNPSITLPEKSQIRSQLERWVKLEICPLEDPDFRTPNESHRSRRHRARHHHHHHHHQQQQHQVVVPENSVTDSDDEESEAAAKNVVVSSKPPILGPDPTIVAAASSLSSTSRRRRKHLKPRTIFHKALDALLMDWDNDQLQMLLKHDVVPPHMDSEKVLVNEYGQFLWHGKNLNFL